MHTLVAVAWSVNLPPGSAVSLHSRPTARDCGRASAARSDGGETLSPSGTIAAKIMGGMLKGWLRNVARDPVLYFLVLALWRDARRFQNQTRLELRKVNEKLDPLVKEKDQRIKEKDQRIKEKDLAASMAFLLPDQGQGRTNWFSIQVFMPEGLPDLESKRFHLDVLAGSRADPDGQKLQLTYSNGPLRQVWRLDVPDGMVVDAAELASCRWSFEVEESDFPIVRLALRCPFATRDGAPGGSPPSFTDPRPPEP